MPGHHGHLRSLPPYVGGDDDDEVTGFQAVCCGCGFTGEANASAVVALRELVDHLNDALLERGDRVAVWSRGEREDFLELVVQRDGSPAPLACIVVWHRNGAWDYELVPGVADFPSRTGIEHAPDDRVAGLREELSAAVASLGVTRAFVNDLNARTRGFIEDIDTEIRHFLDDS